MYIIAHRGVGASFCARASVRSYIPVHVIFCNKCHLSLEGDPSEIIAVLKEQAAGRGMDALASMLQDVIKHRRTEIGMSSPRVCHVPYSGRPPPLRPSERRSPAHPGVPLLIRSCRATATTADYLNGYGACACRCAEAPAKHLVPAKDRD